MHDAVVAILVVASVLVAPSVAPCNVYGRSVPWPEFTECHVTPTWHQETRSQGCEFARLGVGGQNFYTMGPGIVSVVSQDELARVLLSYTEYINESSFCPPIEAAKMTITQGQSQVTSILLPEPRAYLINVFAKLYFARTTYTDAVAQYLNGIATNESVSDGGNGYAIRLSIRLCPESEAVNGHCPLPCTCADPLRYMCWTATGECRCRYFNSVCNYTKCFESQPEVDADTESFKTPPSDMVVCPVSTAPPMVAGVARHIVPTASVVAAIAVYITHWAI